MLEKVEISDYRSCVNTVIDFQSDLSVLIGPNGSGKTNILKALLLLRELATNPERGYRTREGVANECLLKATFRYKKKRAILTTTIQVAPDENNIDEIYASKESWYVREFTGDRKRISFPLWALRHMVGISKDYDERDRLAEIKYQYYHLESMFNTQIPDSLMGPFTEIYEFLSEIKYYSASQFTNPSLCPVSFEVMQDENDFYRPVRIKGHERFLRDLYGAKNTSSYQEFFNVIGPEGIGLVDDIKFNDISTSTVHHTVKSGGKVYKRKAEKLIVVPQFLVGRDALSPSQLSEGTFKTITLLFYLMTEQSSALFVEEPEVCVHHGLLSSIVELIKTYSKRKQIIISTHSDFVLDQIEPRNVYRVSRMGEKGTVVTQIEKSISAKELKALKIYLETEGNLGEYWRHGGFE